jgi:hypothetical protein
MEKTQPLKLLKPSLTGALTPGARIGFPAVTLASGPIPAEKIVLALNLSPSAPAFFPAQIWFDKHLALSRTTKKKAESPTDAYKSYNKPICN